MKKYHGEYGQRTNTVNVRIICTVNDAVRIILISYALHGDFLITTDHLRDCYRWSRAPAMTGCQVARSAMARNAATSRSLA